MDSFMDKIAHKFTAQDMIKANAAAEEKELERLRVQVAEYDTRIQEIRKLNLKNLELADNLQAMIDAGNAKIKAYADAQDQSGQAEGAAAQGVTGEQLEDLSQKLITQTKQLTMAKLETMERLDALENRLNTRAELEQIVEKLEKSSVSEELIARLDTSEKLNEIAAKLEQQPTSDEIAEKLNYRTAFEGIASKLDRYPTLDEIAERLASEKPEGFEERLNAVKEELTDHVHKENVKVYRNVQAAVVDENKKLAEAIAASQIEMKEQLARTEKNVAGLKTIAIVTLIAALANIGIWAASIFNLLPTF
ncbi:MAG: hypothetical protein HDR15_12615 [Lachnospiraceae bacterium]|nr:hypothetical protein [Lachnospiraceae bacterium]